MYIRRSVRKYKGKTYTNYLLVESVSTPKGPRQKTICSLGSLAPGPPEQWRELARRLQAALSGQLTLEAPDEKFAALVEKARRGRKRRRAQTPASDAVVTVDTDRVQTEKPRTAGAVHVGHQMWLRLGLDEILKQAGLDEQACKLTEVMTLNRLIAPSSELAMPDWVRRTALGDILGVDFARLEENKLYRNMDSLYPNRELIERELSKRESSLFNLDDTFYFYDLTSTYFEGEAKENPQAKFGYSRDKRPDCKQVLVGLVLDRNGFPKAHEVFDGNTPDGATIAKMLDTLEKRVGKKPGSTVIVDRGMACRENLEEIRRHGYHYLVACRQAERNEWLEELEQEEGWQEVVRLPSPGNAYQKKSKVEIKRRHKGNEVFILCRSKGRQQKERAIREKQAERFLKALEKLKQRVEKGHLKRSEKIHQAIGRLKERYCRVARYYSIEYDAEGGSIRWQEDLARKETAEKLDGSYVLKTDHQDLSQEEIWRSYVLLTRVEDAFRDMKSPLMERPIFHRLQHRTQTHIFLCVLAYHLLVVIEQYFLDRGIHTSWSKLREQLSTHQVVTVVLPTESGAVLRIRKGTTPEAEHRFIYETLQIPMEVMKPIRIWTPAS